MTVAKNKTYQATARIIAIVEVDLPAKSLEDAALQAQELRVEDFITVDGEHLDSSIKITGVNGPDHFSSEQ